MIHFIEGRSGCGKTEHVYKLIEALVNSGEKHIVLIIPEQSSFDCETALLRKLGPALSQKIKVTSFTRLYNMVMSETGAVKGTPIDDSIRRILMSQALQSVADKLEHFKSQAAKPSFTELAINAVKEFKKCGITCEMLKDAAAPTFYENGGTTELRGKLAELALIYEAYDAFVERSGVDPYDNDMRLEKRIAETRFFKGFTVFVDDFTGFTAQQHKIISLLMEQSKEFYITLCTDPQKEDDLFFTVNRTKQRLLLSAANGGLKIASPIKLTENLRTKSDALKILEKNIYRRTKLKNLCGTTEEAINDSIRLIRADDAYEECAEVARCISELALSGKCRYKDIAVIFRKGERYMGVLDAALERCGVPFFMSKPMPVENKPLIRLAVSALELAISPNDERKLFAAAKTGLFKIWPHEIARLENYAFVWSLKGRSFFSEFTMPPDGYTSNITDRDKFLLAAINKTRATLTAPLAEFMNAVSGGELTARDISTALYKLMNSCGAADIIKARAKAENEFSGEQVRVWNLFCNILDKLSGALGTQYISLRRYCELFKMVVRGEDISDIPKTQDQVVVGKADSIRLSKPYAVFVIGALDGEFPHRPVTDGVFSDAERRFLISRSLPLYDALDELYKQELFHVYSAVSAPTDKLFVSYPMKELKGGASEPSGMISDIRRIFPCVNMIDASQIQKLDRIVNYATAFEQCANDRNENSAFRAALCEHLHRSGTKYAGRVDSLTKPIKNVQTRLGKEAATALFGKEKRLSSTRLEAFYKCRFMYLFQYGLNVSEPSKAELNSLVYGNIVHFVLENVIRKYIERGCTPFPDDELNKLLDRLLEEYIESELGGKSGKDERFMFLYARSKKRVAIVIDNLMKELAQSGFTPVYAELVMDSSENGLPEYIVDDGSGGKVHLIGKIDRLDVMDDGGKTYVRVTDYKSSEKAVTLNEITNGLKMQMFIYLLAAVKNGEALLGKSDLEPAGVLYRTADIGNVEIKEVSGQNSDELAEKREREVTKKLKMKGVAIDDKRILDAIDSTKSQWGTYAYTENITAEDMKLVFGRVEELVKQMSRALNDGDLAPTPVNVNDSESCEYCPYKAVCRLDSSDEIRTIPKADTESVLENLRQEQEKKKSGAESKEDADDE